MQSCMQRPGGSLVLGAVPEGCRRCQAGAKIVLFVTGLCDYDCFYCPVSEAKIDHDVIYVDEVRVRQDQDIVEEARAIQARGAAITGGDPLRRVDRTLRYIRLLKDEFGMDFHIHLYTQEPNPAKVKRLAAAGLDEIRFHPPAETWSDMDDGPYEAAIRTARDAGLTVGLEVPLLPDREEDLGSLIAWAQRVGAEYVNLNELEFSEVNALKLRTRGYRMKEHSSGVIGCEEAARRLLAKPWAIPVHYCTSNYKDGIQLHNRLMRRAKAISTPRDVITPEGTLVKGIVETENPSEVLRKIRQRFRVPADLAAADAARRRVEVAPWILEEIAPSLGAPAFIVEEYPTAERTEVERRPLAVARA